MIEETYKEFKVYKNKDNNIFIHINIESDKFYDELIEFFFKEEKLLSYIKNKTSIKFDASIQQFVSLYKTLNGFIDDENLQININDLKKELSKYIDWENYSDDELLKLRRDKIGKVGEYIFHNILADYFKFTCILPKLILTTNKNMSIFGIDVIFWNNEEKMLLFGESKVSKSLDKGIALINQSLSNYEHQIKEEYRTILSSELLSINLPEEMKSYIGKALNFDKFIKIAKINKIGVPIFIMNGNDSEPEEISNKLNKINKTKFMNLDTIYYVINIPIIDKNIFQSKIINYLRERCDYYESKC
ncbi:MAG: DUF1837 domain-containing protein [Firmicutes bacterium]|nr:DUF1837 domain-containing protein [Bacillota bacterium]